MILKCLFIIIEYLKQSKYPGMRDMSVYYKKNITTYLRPVWENVSRSRSCPKSVPAVK